MIRVILSNRLAALGPPAVVSSCAWAFVSVMCVLKASVGSVAICCHREDWCRSTPNFLTLFSWHSLETIMMGYKLLLTLT
jgi:hypothetical protein